MKSIAIVSYDKKWPLEFAAEKEALKATLGEQVLDIQHIGSTSIEGLAAKDVIDILCVVDSLSVSDKLQSMGYQGPKEHNIPLRYYFKREVDGRKVHLHVCEPDHPFIALNLAFRDHLRSHAEDRAAYQKIKEQLLNDPEAGKVGDGKMFSQYNLGKDQFIKSVLQKAGFCAYRLNFCAHHAEWEAYHAMHKASEKDYDETKLNREIGHYYFCFYKGTQIAGCAHVELKGKEAAVHSILMSEDFGAREHKDAFQRLLNQWLTRQKVHVR